MSRHRSLRPLRPLHPFHVLRALRARLCCARAPDEQILELFHSLKRSPYEEIRSHVEGFKQSLFEMNRTGMQTAQMEVANKKHLEALCDMIDMSY